MQWLPHYSVIYCHPKLQGFTEILTASVAAVWEHLEKFGVDIFDMVKLEPLVSSKSLGNKLIQPYFSLFLYIRLIYGATNDRGPILFCLGNFV